MSCQVILNSQHMEHAGIERLLRMADMLGSNVDYTTLEIARHLAVSERTAYRYINTLKFNGFAMSKKKRNIHKLFRMPTEEIKLADLIMLSSEEAFIIHNVLHSIAGDSPLMHNLELKLAALFDSTSITEIIGNKTSAENIKILKNAIKNKYKVILMNYQSGHTMKISDREVEPYGFSTNYADVYAYEVATGQNKTFKISRIGWVKPTCHEWENEDKHEVISPDCFRMNGKESISVILKMSLMAKSLLIEEYPLSISDISYEYGAWWLKTTVKDLAGVGRFVMGLADQIEIVESPELKDYLKRFRDTYLQGLG